MLGELHCGDLAAAWTSPGLTTLLIVDGLGHGRDAEVAAMTAFDYTSRHHAEPIVDILAGCNDALRSTRGAAMGLAQIDERQSRMTYAGIGNTRAAVFGARTTRLSSSYGIVGLDHKTLAPEVVRLAAFDLIVLSTDGIREFFDIEAPGESTDLDAGMLARRIVMDWGTERDDAAALVYWKTLP
jgi:hypothetical protein